MIYLPDILATKIKHERLFNLMGKESRTRECIDDSSRSISHSVTDSPSLRGTNHILCMYITT